MPSMAWHFSTALGPLRLKIWKFRQPWTMNLNFEDFLITYIYGAAEFSILVEWGTSATASFVGIVGLTVATSDLLSLGK